MSKVAQSCPTLCDPIVCGLPGSSAHGISQARTLEWVGCTYVAQPGTRVATVCAGYADGVNRLISNRGQVLVRGQRCPIIGRVCMDQFMIDVTKVPETKVGDVVTIFGRDGDDEITADDVADLIGTIGYEVTCLITPRVPRVYIEDGQVVSVHRPLLG